MMSTMALRLPRGFGWKDGRRVVAIAAVTVLHLLLLGQLLLPQPLPQPRPLPQREEVTLVFEEPPAPPPPPIVQPEPPPLEILRQPEVVPPPIQAPPVAPVREQLIAPSTAFTQTSAEPVAPIAPYQAPTAAPRSGPTLQALTLLRSPPPVYPRTQQQRRIGGTVRLRIRVGTDGRAAAVVVDRSSGTTALDQAAVRVVQRSWRFKPGMNDGVAVERWGVVSIQFKPGD